MSVRWVGIAEETSYGTKVATPAQSMPYLELDATLDQGYIDIVESGYREPTETLMGAAVGSGTLSFPARADNIGRFLKWAYGAVTSEQIGTSIMYKHIFTLADAINSFTLSDNRGISGVNSRYLTGVLVKKLTLEAPAREMVTASLDLQYAWEELAAAPTMGTFPSVRPFVFHDAVLSVGGSAVGEVEAFSVGLENTIPDDVHSIGSRKIPEIILEGATFSGEVDLKFKGWAMRQYFYGSATASEPQEEVGTASLVITLTGEPTGVPDKPYYELVLTYPKVVFKESTVPVSRRERLTQRFTFTALRDAGTKAELYNKQSSY